MRSAGRLGSMMLAAVLALSVPRWSGAQSFEFHAPPSATDARTPAVMRDLAERLLPVYQEADPDRYLANLSVLQLTAGDYSAAAESRESLHERRRRADAGRPVGRGRVLDLYARAKTIEADRREPFADAFGQAYQEMFSKLNDHDAFMLSGWLSANPQDSQESFDRLLDEQRSKDIVNQQEAETLLSAFVQFEAYHALAPLVGSLDEADGARRYAETEITVKVPGRGSIGATVVRPKTVSTPLPALLELGIDRPTVSAKESAAHGYVGVFADLRRRQAGAVPFVVGGDHSVALPVMRALCKAHGPLAVEEILHVQVTDLDRHVRHRQRLDLGVGAAFQEPGPDLGHSCSQADASTIFLAMESNASMVA